MAVFAKSKKQNTATWLTADPILVFSYLDTFLIYGLNITMQRLSRCLVNSASVEITFVFALNIGFLETLNLSIFDIE